MNHESGDTAKAMKLAEVIEAELRSLVERVSENVGVPEKFVWADIAYQATQMARQPAADGDPS